MNRNFKSEYSFTAKSGIYSKAYFDRLESTEYLNFHHSNDYSQHDWENYRP